jgi:hypothetical protein
MDPTVLGVGLEVVLFDDPAQEQAQGHFHMFKIFKGSGEIIFFYIKAHVLCIWCAHDTVPMQLCRVNVGGADTEFAVVRNQITHHGNLDPIRIILLGMVVDNRIANVKNFSRDTCVLFRRESSQTLHLFLFALFYYLPAPFLQNSCQMLFATPLRWLDHSSTSCNLR